MGKGRRRKGEGIGIHPREVPSNFSAVVAPMVCCQSSGLDLRSGGLGLLRSLLCHVYSLCDGKSYFPSLHVTVSLDPALPHCIVLRSTAGLICVAVTAGVVVLGS